jgi:Ca2+-binding EF-hand superfamily protein
MMFIVNQMATREEKKELMKVFQQLDTNGDGKLSREELLNGKRVDYNKKGILKSSENSIRN